jgi:hypothetical protein
VKTRRLARRGHGFDGATARGMQAASRCRRDGGVSRTRMHEQVPLRALSGRGGSRLRVSASC